MRESVLCVAGTVAAFVGLAAPFECAAAIMPVARIEITADPPAPAASQPADKPVAKSEPAEPTLPPQTAPYREERALWLSFGTTLGGIVAGVAIVGLGFAFEGDTARVTMGGIGLGIAGAGFLVGPGLGHFYVKNTKQAVWDLVLRTTFSGASAGLFAGGFGSAMGSAMCHGYSAIGGDSDEDEEVEDCPQNNSVVLFTFGGIAAATAIGLAIADLATVRRAAQRANEPAAASKVSNVSLVPVVAPGPDGSTTTGLAFSMRF
jgi:hypothetical protein